MRIDLNCDLGEGFPFDADLMPLITSANVSCGGHAGDEPSITRALQLARTHNVQLGAHPGFPDRPHMGRRELPITPEQAEQLCRDQLAHLHRLGGQPLYLKPHGALYNMACRDPDLAAALARLGLPLLGLPGSALQVQCVRAGVPFIAEGFADRRYLRDGSLVPRSHPDAFIHSPTEAVAQAQRLIEQFGVQTLCVHGDNPHAVTFVRALRAALQEADFDIRPFDLS